MPTHAPITVVLAHFDDLFAAGLRELIERDPSLAIVAADVGYGRIGVVLRAHRPAVAILDLGAVGKLAEIRELNSDHPATRLVLLGGDPAPAECAQLLALGASACLGRDTQSRDVINAIHLASRGLQVIPRAPAASGGAPVAAGVGLLTKREAEVLPLLQRGDSNPQIALALQVGVETVRTHARNIYRKLGVSSRRELAAAPPAREPQPQPARPEPRRRTGTPLGRPRRGGGMRHG